MNKAKQEVYNNRYQAMKRIGTALLALNSLRRMTKDGKISDMLIGDIDTAIKRIHKIEKLIERTFRVAIEKLIAAQRKT
jgi:hypothetical protein